MPIPVYVLGAKPVRMPPTTVEEHPGYETFPRLLLLRNEGRFSFSMLRHRTEDELLLFDERSRTGSWPIDLSVCTISSTQLSRCLSPSPQPGLHPLGALFSPSINILSAVYSRSYTPLISICHDLRLRLVDQLSASSVHVSALKKKTLPSVAVEQARKVFVPGSPSPWSEASVPVFRPTRTRGWPIWCKSAITTPRWRR